jgi:hypothetical protein
MGTSKGSVTLVSTLTGLPAFSFAVNKGALLGNRFVTVHVTALPTSIPQASSAQFWTIRKAAYFRSCPSLIA